MCLRRHGGGLAQSHLAGDWLCPQPTTLHQEKRRGRLQQLYVYCQLLHGNVDKRLMEAQSSDCQEELPQL